MNTSELSNIIIDILKDYESNGCLQIELIDIIIRRYNNISEESICETIKELLRPPAKIIMMNDRIYLRPLDGIVHLPENQNKNATIHSGKIVKIAPNNRK